MGEDRLTGLALVHIHKVMDVDSEEIIDNLVREQPRRMKLDCILKDLNCFFFMGNELAVVKQKCVWS